MLHKYRKGTIVETLNGDVVGEISRVVIDPQTQQVSHLIVKQGFLFTEDKVIRVEDVVASDGDKLRLRKEITDADELMPYQEAYFIPAYELDEDNSDSELRNTEIVPARYLYPPIAAGNIMDQDYLAGAPHMVKYKKTNVPGDKVEISTGTDVVSSEGKVVGQVEKIIMDSSNQIITHFMISEGMFFKNHKLIPTTWVDITTDDSVKLYMSSDFLNTLPDFAEEAAY